MAATFSLSGNLRLVPRWEDDIGPADLSDTTTFLQTIAISDGTGSGQANAYWRDVLNLNASEEWQYDGDTLPLTVMGASGNLSIATPRLLYVRNRSATSTVRWATDNGPLDIPAGGTFLWYAPAAVSATPFLVASITNIGAAAATVEVMVVGVKS